MVFVLSKCYGDLRPVTITHLSVVLKKMRI